MKLRLTVSDITAAGFDPVQVNLDFLGHKLLSNEAVMDTLVMALDQALELYYPEAVLEVDENELEA